MCVCVCVELGCEDIQDETKQKRRHEKNEGRAFDQKVKRKEGKP